MITENTYAVPFLSRVAARFGFFGFAEAHALRAASYQATRATLAAAKVDRTTADWPRMTLPPMEVWATDAATIRSRANHMAQSDPYGVRVADALVKGMVGDGIRTQVTVDWLPQKEDNEKKRKKNQAINNRIELLKHRWMRQADSEHIGAERRGKRHWFDLQQLIFRRVVIDGEAIVMRQFIKTRAGRAELRWSLLSIERLSSNGAAPADGNALVEGVEIDPAGGVVAYHIAPILNGTRYSAGYLPTRVPASDIIHVYRHDFPEQYRGFSWFAPIIPDLNHLANIKTYSLIARRVQSAIALVVSRSPQASGGAVATPFRNALPGQALEGKADATQPAAPRAIQPGMIQDVGEGAEIHSHIPSPAGDLDPLTKLLLRGIGCSIGLSYEQITADYSGTSFAGGRLGKLETDATRRTVNAWFARAFETPAHIHFIDHLRTTGQLQDILLDNGIRDIHPDVDLYEARFSRPRTEWGVNPLQEVMAASLAIEKGLETLRDNVEARGRDLDDHMEQIAIESGPLQQVIQGYAQAATAHSPAAVPADPAAAQEPAPPQDRLSAVIRAEFQRAIEEARALG